MNGKKKETPIGDIIPDVLRRMGVKKRLSEGALVREWPEIVGEALARRSSVRDLRDGVLFIEAQNNVWMQEINFLQKRILAKIRDRYPDLDINGIRLFIDRERGEG